GGIDHKLANDSDKGEEGSQLFIGDSGRDVGDLNDGGGSRPHPGVLVGGGGGGGAKRTGQSEDQSGGWATKRTDSCRTPGRTGGSPTVPSIVRDDCRWKLSQSGFVFVVAVAAFFAPNAA